ncbi:MAG: hypothetical protein EXX96DRAFT_521113 [Benjaminiella poitrasii]|nr:MAG: hypothetical protein EXX96DRAFT_521113 [Benjaminiella poitrasii]
MSLKEKNKPCHAQQEQAQKSEETTLSNVKKPSGAPKRHKIVKACKDCRRRKVKCDGATPCSTCQRSSIPCIFESTSPKRGATKHYIESLENRINVIENVLTTLSAPTMQLVEEAIRRQQIIDESDYIGSKQSDIVMQHPEDKFLVNELGCPGYIQDITNRMLNYGLNQDSQSSVSSPSPKSSSNRLVSKEDVTDIENYIQFYLIQIQPYFPLFVPSHFKRQFAANELPIILIYAMCALGSFFQQTGEDEMFYRKAIIILDEAVGKPSVALVQALLLLIKYMECINGPCFFNKTKSLIARVIEMCKILKLHQVVVNNNYSTPDPESETGKRTFCMAFSYSTLICVEQNIESDFNTISIKELASLLPTTLADESTVECQRYFISFSFTLSQIHQHIIRVTRRQELQKDLRSDSQILEENMALLHLQVMIEDDLMHLPSNLSYNASHNNKNQYPFPAEEEVTTSNVSPMTRLLHMLYHLNVILLHFHYFIHPLPQGSNEKTTNYAHRQMCASSASNMIRLVEGLLQDSNRPYRYIPRGLQFVAHCIVTALSVLRIELSFVKDMKSGKVYFDEYQRCIFADPYFPPSTIMSRRRNTISEKPYHQRAPTYPIVVPQSLLQSSSTDLNSFSLNAHQPLQNIHAAPLQIHQSTTNYMSATMPPLDRNLRGSTQSCHDLRSLYRLHNKTIASPQQHGSSSFGQLRKPIASVISSSSTNSGQYRSYNSNGGGGSAMSSRNAGKIRRVRKSVSIHGLSNTYQRQQQQYHTYQSPVQTQSMPFNEFLYSQQPEEQSLLHRPYQPSYDDDNDTMKLVTDNTASSATGMMIDDFPMNVDFNHFLSSYPLPSTNDNNHHLLEHNRTESQQIL